MKSVFGLAVIMISLVLFSFRPNFTMDDVTGAMRAGNVGQLAQYLDTHVDIALPEKSDTYSKSQAEMIIRDFFTTNEVQNFMIKHQGENGASEYCVGVLQTRNGDYRTTLFIKVKDNRQLVQEL